METGSPSQDAITAKQNLIKNQFLGSIKPVYFIFPECLLLAVTQFHCVAVLSVKNIAQTGYLKIFHFFKMLNFIILQEFTFTGFVSQVQGILLHVLEVALAVLGSC